MEPHHLQLCEIMEREREEGRAEGRAEERADRNVDLIQKKLDKHKGIAQIADELEETVESIRNMMRIYQNRLRFPEWWED